MKIRIFQIDMNRDKQNACFMNYEWLMKKGYKVDPSIYDCVYEGEVNCKSLESVYALFNFHYPKDYKARSLSLSDVVEIISVSEGDFAAPGCYYCDTRGFKEVEFAFKEKENNEKIYVLLIKPGMEPELVQMENSVEGMHELIGGYVEQHKPFGDGVVILCDEDAKRLKLPLNRAIYSPPKEIPMSFSEMKYEFLRNHDEGKPALTGYLVFTEDSFSIPYSEESRTYEISSNNKFFLPEMGGNSLFGSSLDGTDRNVRLDQYMANIYGGKDGWKLERCYLREENPELLYEIRGDMVLAYQPPESSSFADMPVHLADKYAEKFALSGRVSAGDLASKTAVREGKNHDETAR